MSFPTDRIVLGTLCYVLRQDSVLLLRRTRPPQAGFWSPPGGKVELGEAPAECVIREIYEETGLRIAAPELRALVTVVDQDWPIYWQLLIYRTRRFSGEIQQSGEGEVRWIPFDQLDQIQRPYGDLKHWPHVISDAPGIWQGKFIYDKPGNLIDEIYFT